MQGNEPLIVRSETSAVHYAVLVGGLSAVTESEVTPLPSNISTFIENNYEEWRVEDTCRIMQINTNANPETNRLKIRRLYAYGTKLFILTNPSDGRDGRLYIYDFADNGIGLVVGDIIGLTPRITDKNATADLFLQTKASAVPASFLILRQIVNDASFDVLSFATKADTEILTGTREYDMSEFVVGDISLHAGRATILDSIKLIGKTDRYDKDDANYDANSTTRARVFGYCANYSEDALLEFLYNPLDDRYYGRLEGDDIRILVQGNYFDITAIEARVDSGILV
tara:strand:+ start:115 stop:966 length:852 start_codon:yes stop_codon:yes gene_type:complete